MGEDPYLFVFEEENLTISFLSFLTATIFEYGREFYFYNADIY